MFTVRSLALLYLVCILVAPILVLAQQRPISERHKLRWRKPSGTKLEICEGDCDVDSDCKAPFKCYKRRDGEKRVPGCGGSTNDGWRDFCYLSGQALFNREKPNASPETYETIQHIGTTHSYVKGSKVYKAKIKVPEGTRAGDLLILVLHRTDDFLPLEINDYGGWIRAAECYKTGNGKDCATYLDCKTCVPKRNVVGTKNVFCEHFNEGGQLGRKTDGSGHDLAQTIFYKKAGAEELEDSKPLSIVLSPWENQEQPAWMFMSAFRGADTDDPIRDWNGTGNDGSAHSVFPSAYGEPGDLMLLSQGFDSGAPGVKERSFLPPKGFDNYVSMFDCDNPLSRNSWSYGCDESGYLFGKVLKKDGETGNKISLGEGSAIKGDSLLSLTIIPKGGSRDGKGRGASEWLGNSQGQHCPKNHAKP